MPSFDIVSRIELPEVDNALAGITREIGTRFDFKGSKCKVERQEGALDGVADAVAAFVAGRRQRTNSKGPR